MSIYDYKNYTGTDTAAWPEYNPNMFKGMGHSRFDARNMIRPDNLSPDMGASNYQAPPPPQLNPLDPNWQNQLAGYGSTMDRGNIDNTWRNTIKDKIGNFAGNIPGITGALLKKFNPKRSPEKQAAYESIMGSIDPDTGRGMYKGNEYRIEGNKIYSELNPYGLNFDSAFGSKSIEEMDQKKIDWATDRLDKGKNISDRLRNILINRGLYKEPTGIDLTKIEDPGKGGAIVDTGTGGAAVTTGGGGTFNPAMDEKGRLNTGDSWHGATEARGQAFQDTGGKQGQVAGPGFGKGAYWAEGGRVGYRGGELVDEDVNIEGPGFDVNENIEMAEKSPFEMRIDELMDEGMSWQEAYQIASEEFGQMAEGPEESFSEEGIASIV